MEQVEGKLVLRPFPERLFRVEADVAVLVIGEVFPAGRHGDAHILPGLLGKRLGQLAHVVLGEGLLLDVEFGGFRNRRQKARAQRCDDRAKRCRRPQELTP